MKKEDFNILLEKIKSNIYKDNLLDFSLSSFDESIEADKLNDEDVILLVEAVKYNPNIKSINLAGNSITDIGIQKLSEISFLEELNLSENFITSLGITMLANTNIKKLILSVFPSFNSEDEAHLPLFNNMIDALIHNKTIMDIGFDCCYIPDEMIARLIQYNTTIKNLYLGSYLTNSCLKTIKYNTSLESLFIPKSDITDLGVFYLSENESLKTLTIAQSHISDKGAKLLSSCGNLKEIIISDSDITIQGIKYFLNSNLDNLLINTNLKQNILSYEQCEYINDNFSNLQNKQLNDKFEEQKYFIDSINEEQYLTYLIGETYHQE